MNANSSTTNREWLIAATGTLVEAGIATARLDALVILEDVTGKDRAHLLAEPDTLITGNQRSALNVLIQRRREHEPLSYIRGKSEFYGRSFIVNSHTLEPRPETETIIDLCKSLSIEHATVIDVGTGSGCIAISLQLEIPNLTTFGIDIDPECIRVASMNANLLNASTKFIHSSLLESLQPGGGLVAIPDVIVANLPYVPNSYHINQAAGHEPRHAIYGGSDGLDLYRELFIQCAALAQPPSYIVTESLPFQHQGLEAIALQYGFRTIKTSDFIQCFVPV